MHIAINGWFWDQPHIGSGQYLRRLLPLLPRVAPQGTRFSLILPDAAAPTDLPAGVEAVTTRTSRSNWGKINFEQRVFPSQVGRLKADVAFVPYWAPPLSSPAPLVVNILDLIPVVLPEYSKGFLPRLYTSLVSTSARGAAQILTLSEGSKADIVKHLGIPAERITVTPLAADERYHPRMGAERDREVRQRYNLPDRFILGIGGFDLRKNFYQLLLAYSYVVETEGDEVLLVIAGREPKWDNMLFPDLRAFAQDLGIADFIRWTGYIEEDDKPSLYRLAEVFAFPSTYEGFGLPVLEAMASGTPVVAGEIPTNEEIAGDAAFLVPVAPLNASADQQGSAARKMAGALLALLGQPDLRDTMINAGLAQATRFSWRKTAQTTWDVLQRSKA